MATRMVNVLCYWNGQTKMGVEGVEYEGPPPKIIRVHENIDFSELKELLYRLTGWERRHVGLEINGRFHVHSNPIKFIELPIEEEGARSALFSTLSDTVHCIELYLSRKGGCTSYSHDQNVEFDVRTNPPPRDISTQSSHRRNSSGGSINLLTGGVGGVDDRLDVIYEMVDNEEIDDVLHHGHFDSNEEEEDVEEFYSHMGEEEADHVEVGGGGASCSTFEEAPVPSFDDPQFTQEAVFNTWPNEEVPSISSGTLYVNRQFVNKKDLQDAVKCYHIQTNREFMVCKSTPTLLVVKCKIESYPWRLRASARTNTAGFKIVTLRGPHTCVHPILNRGHAQLDCKFIAHHIHNIVKADLTLTCEGIVALIQKDFDRQISYKKAWWAKQKVLENLFGTWESSCKELPGFMDALQQSNPGTVVVWSKVPDRMGDSEVLKRVFWSFHAAIEGFKHCRPVISIDGTFLYGKYKGTILIAVAFDGNNQLFPLAFAYTEGENNSSWAWFMRCIRDHVTRRSGLAVISDRHKGIFHAMKQPGWTEPHAYHRFCIRHLCSNLMTEFKDKYAKKLVEKMARQCQTRKFEQMFAEIERSQEGNIKRWLDEIPLDKWTLCHDGGRRYGTMTTNMSEIFNSVLKGGRFLPITAFVQLTYYRSLKYFAARREFGDNRILLAGDSAFTPEVDLKLQGNGYRAGKHTVTIFHHRHGQFEVDTGYYRKEDTYKGGNKQFVNLQEKTCSCGKFTAYHLPCSHVLAACAFKNIDWRPYVYEYYRMRKYALTWEPMFHPIPDKSIRPIYEGPTLIMDGARRRHEKGRPQSSRIHNEMDATESRTEVRCGICKSVGHNRRTCPHKNTGV